MAGGVVVSGNRVRIKGRKASVARFFIISVAYTVVWIALSSQLGHYRAEYGPQILLQMSIAYYLPSIPVLLLSPNVEKLLEMLVGSCRSMQYRLLFGLAGCAVIAAVYPFMHHQLVLMLCAVMVLGTSSAIAFSTSYQLVAWFRAADTIALGIGCVGSGPLVLILQVALGLKVQPLPWQWIVMFQACAAVSVVGMGCTMSLFWQYGDIISGKVPYVERPLLATEGEEVEEEEDDDFDDQSNALAAMLSRMVSVADPFQGMPLHFTGHVDEGYARMLRAHGLVRRVASADSDLGFLRITAPTSGLDYSVLSRLPMKAPRDPNALLPEADTPSVYHRTETGSIPDSAVAVAGWKGRTSTTSYLVPDSEPLTRRAQSHQSLSGFDDPGGPLHESDSVHSMHNSRTEAVSHGSGLHVTWEPDGKLDAQATASQLPSRLKPISVPEHIPRSAPPTFEPSLAETVNSPPWEENGKGGSLDSTQEEETSSSRAGPGIVPGWKDPSEGENGREQVICVSHSDILDALGKAGTSTRELPHAESHEEGAEEPKKKDGLKLTIAAFRELWLLVMWSLASSTIINLVFPFFTYIPSSGLLGDFLPQVLFYVRIMSDICGRFLPRLKGPFALKSESSIVGLSVVMCAMASVFFILLQNHWGNDWIWMAIVSCLWFTGGFINTNSFTLAPNMVDSALTAQASAIMALTYQVAHFLGLVLAAISAYAMYGDITGGGH